MTEVTGLQMQVLMEERVTEQKAVTCHSPRGDSKLRAPARHAHAMETLTVCAVFRSYRPNK